MTRKLLRSEPKTQQKIPERRSYLELKGGALYVSRGTSSRHRVPRKQVSEFHYRIEVSCCFQDCCDSATILLQHLACVQVLIHSMAMWSTIIFFFQHAGHGANCGRKLRLLVGNHSCSPYAKSKQLSPFKHAKQVQHRQCSARNLFMSYLCMFVSTRIT